jgi:hypothetical protein
VRGVLGTEHHSGGTQGLRTLFISVNL